jgi:hypothetical protein
VNDRLRGGNARDSGHGVDAVQLADSNQKNGKATSGGYQCCANLANLNCSQGCGAGPSAPGATNTCVGKANVVAGPGGDGGKPELRRYNSQVFQWQIAQGVGNGLPVMATVQTAQGGSYNGASASNGQAGAPGADGTAGSDVGSLDSTGDYVVSDGSAGTDGQPGQGGGGGAGNVIGNFNTNDTTDDYVWGWAGGAGGAGGCPGLAATPGRGGGASIGLVAIDSPIMIDQSQIESGKGGFGGSAGAPSAPTPGGSGGYGNNNNYGGTGGAGGRAGISGNGAGGPSFGIASKNGMPIVTNSTVTPGQGGDGVSARTVGIYSIPASPNGKSAATYAF